MLVGRYRDLVTRRGESTAATPWRPNLVVDDAFTLLAALLRGHPGLEGILYWAVGSGDAGWDGRTPTTLSRTSRLTAETRRLEVPRDAIGFVDRRGAPSSEPSPDLEVRLAFEWPDEHVTLREFGIFGGDADARRDSGVMINHVIHPRIDLEPGQRLSRQLRLSFGRARDQRWLDVPPRWLGESPVDVVHGVGDRYVGALADAGVRTVAAFARSDPDTGGIGVPRVPLLELRAKARLALRMAQEVHPPERLHELTVSQVLRSPAADLARDAQVPEEDVTRLRDQLATLELSLDHRFLGPLAVRVVAGGGFP